MVEVTEQKFDEFYAKCNKLSLPPITFDDIWNKSNTVVIRRIKQANKYIGLIRNWTRFYIVK
jgi:hypothetical protein